MALIFAVTVSHVTLLPPKKIRNVNKKHIILQNNPNHFFMLP